MRGRTERARGASAFPLRCCNVRQGGLPELAAHDLAHLPAYTAAVRLCQEGQSTRAFTLSTEPLPAPIERQATRVGEAARRRYGSVREQIEQQFAARHRQRKELHRQPRTPSVPEPALPVGDPVGDPVGEPVGDPLKTGSPHPLEAPANPCKPRSGRGRDTVGNWRMSSLIRRGRMTKRQLTTLPQRRTPRDPQIAVDCFERRVLATGQLECLHSSAARAGRRRLLTLSELLVLDRLRPRRALGQGHRPLPRGAQVRPAPISSLANPACRPAHAPLPRAASALPLLRRRRGSSHHGMSATCPSLNAAAGRRTHRSEARGERAGRWLTSCSRSRNASVGGSTRRSGATSPSCLAAAMRGRRK